MRAPKVILGAIAVLLATAALLLRSSPLPVADRELPAAVAPANSSGQIQEVEASATASVTKSALPLRAIEAGQEKTYLQAAPLSKEEVKSVRTLIGAFFKPPQGRESLNKLIHELRVGGLDPVIARDANPYTGKMLTIRTNEALEGTRYFHAQFFEDSELSKDPVRQHLSFEIRPSPDCMKVSQKIVEEKLGRKLGTPIRVRGDEWIEWKKDGQSIWIKRLGAEDLNADRLNARTIADIGTCRAAIELIPSDHDAAGSHLHN